MPLKPEPELAAETFVRMMAAELDDVALDLSLQGIGRGRVRGWR